MVELTELSVRSPLDGGHALDLAAAELWLLSQFRGRQMHAITGYTKKTLCPRSCETSGKALFLF